MDTYLDCTQLVEQLVVLVLLVRGHASILLRPSYVAHRAVHGMVTLSVCGQCICCTRTGVLAVVHMACDASIPLVLPRHTVEQSMS